MGSRKAVALTATLAGAILSALTLLFTPISYLRSLIRNKDARTYTGIGLFFLSTACLVFLTLKHPVQDGLGEALRSSNVNIVIDEEGDELIKSLPLTVHSFGILIVIGCITWTAFNRQNSITNTTMISPTRALQSIEKHGLMEKFPYFGEMNWRDAQAATGLTNEEMLKLSERFGHPEECVPSSGIIYIIGLSPLLAGAYLAPTITGQPPSIYWMDHAGGYLADAASYVLSLFIQRDLNLRHTTWSIPVLLAYYGILGGITFRYAKAGYNALLLSHIEQRDQAAKRKTAVSENSVG